jgi:hypothetical protein
MRGGVFAAVLGREVGWYLLWLGQSTVGSQPRFTSNSRADFEEVYELVVRVETRGLVSFMAGAMNPLRQSIHHDLLPP